jgi:hypothetical protein
VVAKFATLDDEPDERAGAALKADGRREALRCKPAVTPPFWTVNRRAAGPDWKSSGRFGAGDQGLRCPPPWSMIRKSGHRFSLATNAERVCAAIMLKQKDRLG